MRLLLVFLLLAALSASAQEADEGADVETVTAGPTDPAPARPTGDSPVSAGRTMDDVASEAASGSGDATAPTMAGAPADDRLVMSGTGLLVALAVAAAGLVLLAMVGHRTTHAPIEDADDGRWRRDWTWPRRP